MAEIIQNIKLEDVLGERFGRYSKYVIQDRAIPDVRDGLKPVQRRILYSMYKEGNTFDKQFRKSARTVGDVIGKYHPHGDYSVYEAMVRLSQDWKMRQELVNMHGNIGSVDGDPAAAMRYTEAKLSEISNELLKDINKDTVQFVNNYDDTEVEPTVLPSRFPNLIVNGATGISAGYATDIPPHNLSEIIDATLKVIDKPSTTVDEIMQIVPGPDFPTGGVIQGTDGIKQAYKTGKGKINVRSKIRTEDVRGGKTHIIIEELPFDVNKAMLVKRMDEVRAERRVEGIIEVRDESDREGLRIVIETRKDAQVEGIINYLLKKTDLQVNYHFNMVAISDRAPKQLGIIEILNSYIAHQKDVVTRRSEFDLNAAEKRMHILQGLMKALSILDEVIRVIRESENKKNAKDNLIEAFDFSEAQAEAIVMLQLYRLTNTDIAELEAESSELEFTINQLKEILGDEKQLLKVIKSELRAIRKKYDNPRRSVIEDKIETIELDMEVIIPREDMIVTVTRDGYMKRTSLRSFNASLPREIGMKETDRVMFQAESNTLEQLVLFTNKGRYMIVPVHELPEIRWKDSGQHVSTNFKLGEDERLNGAVTVESFDQELSIYMVTKRGQIKHTLLKDFEAVRIKRPMAAMKVKPDDDIISIEITDVPSDIILVTHRGVTLRFGVDQVSATGLRGQGVRAMNVKPDDYIVGAHITRDNHALITVSQRGAVKKTLHDEIDVANRAQVGTMLYKENKSKPHRVVGSFMLTDKATIELASEKTNSKVKIKDIRPTGKYLNGSFVFDTDEFGLVESVIVDVHGE